MIHIEVDDRKVLNALEGLRQRASNMMQIMHAIGQALVEAAFPAHAGIDPLVVAVERSQSLGRERAHVPGDRAAQIDLTTFEVDHDAPKAIERAAHRAKRRADCARADHAQLDAQKELAHTCPMNAAFALVFAAAMLACALWLPVWALLPAGALLAWLLPGAVGVAFGLIHRRP